MLEQIQPSRWSPTAWSSGTLLKKDRPAWGLAGGFNSVELVSAAARRRRLHLRGVLATLHRVGCSQDRRAPRPPAAVSFGTGLGGQMNEVL